MLTAYLLTLAALGATPTPLDAFFTEFAAKRDKILVLEAQYTQKAALPGEVVTTEGTLFYAQPRRILFREQDRVTAVDGHLVYEYEPEIKQMVVYDLADQPDLDVFFIAFDSEPQRLREKYDVSLLEFPDETLGKRGLLIKPKPENAKDSPFLEVNIYLRDDNMLPYRIRVEQPEDGQVTILLNGYNVNHNPAPERAQIDLAEGTKIIADDTVVETVGPGGKRIPAPMRFDGTDMTPAKDDDIPSLLEVRPLPPPETPPTPAAEPGKPTP